MRRSLFAMPFIVVALGAALAGCQPAPVIQSASTPASDAQPIGLTPSSAPQNVPVGVVPTKFTGLEGCDDGRVISLAHKGYGRSFSYRCTTVGGAQYWLFLQDPNTPSQAPAPASTTSPTPTPGSAPLPFLPSQGPPPPSGAPVEYRPAFPGGVPQTQVDSTGCREGVTFGETRADGTSYTYQCTGRYGQGQKWVLVRGTLPADRPPATFAPDPDPDPTTAQPFPKS